MHSVDHLRVFVALSVPEEIKDSIEKTQTALKRALPDKAARWTRRQQFHLTLRFLGNVAASSVKELIESMHGVCRNFAPLQLQAAGLGFFPDKRFPRVLWAGINDEVNQLEPLWRAIQTATQPFTTEKPENAFVGHVTLARFNRLRRPEADSLLSAAGKLENMSFGKWTAEQLELMRSELSSQGARHTLLASLPLAGK